MIEERKETGNPALMLIFQRQLFYVQQLRLVLIALLLNVLVLTILGCMAVYLHRHPVHPIYFATDDLGRLVIEPPLNQPNMQAVQVGEWARNAVEKAYTYDFMNYRLQLQSAQRYFTEYGWKKYMQGLQDSNNLLALKERKLIVIAHVIDTPRLVVQGILGGRYAWKFQMPVLVTYMQPPYDEKSQFQNPLQVNVVVGRQKLLASDHGLGIIQIVGNLAFTAPARAPTATGG